MSTTATGGEFAELIRHGPTIERRWVDIVNGHISGVVWGTAPELVLLHDQDGSARSWDEVLLALDRPAVAIDLPGHGRSSRRPNGDYPLRIIGRNVADAIRSFSPGRGQVLVGQGLGAQIAVVLATRFPELVRRLVVIGPAPDFDGELTVIPAGDPAEIAKALRSALA